MSPDIKENNLSVKSRYRPEIDGLRAFAVITVIINHFNKEILPNGYLGVDIFFVISGFVITSSLYQRPSKNFKDFISGFYERRIKRLVPALSVFVLITSIAICLFNPIPGTSLLTGLTSLFGLSNLFLFHKATDYFAKSAELNVFTHTWSLGVEEQFYILFPFLIWFSGFGRQNKNGARNLFLIVGALTIASLIGFIYLYPINQPAAYFLMPTRFWEMASGCLLFIGSQKSKYIEQLLKKVPPLLVVALIIAIMYLPISWTIISTISVVVLSLVLIASLKKGTGSYTFFTNSRVVYIGLISYSLYLWHWGVLSISRWTIGIHWWSVPLQVALMFGLAIASYKYIETPIRKGNLFVKRWKTLVVGGGVLITLSGGLIALAKQFKHSLLINRLDRNIGLPSSSKYSTNCRFSRSDAIEKMATIKISSCTKKAVPQKRHVFIYGDSIAFSYFPIKEELLKNRYSYTFFSGWACRFYDTTNIFLDKRNSSKSCRKGNEMFSEHLRNNASRGDAIIIAFSNRDDFANSPKLQLKAIQRFADYIISVMNIAQANNSSVFILEQLPQPQDGFNPDRCLFYKFQSKNICQFIPAIDSPNSKFDLTLRKLLKDKDIYFVNQSALLDSTDANWKEKAYKYFYNPGHLNPTMTKSMLPELINYIEKNNQYN